MNNVFKIFLIIGLFGCSSAVFGQVPINFGFAGGVSQTNYVLGDDTLNTEYQTGWQGGVFARIKIKDVYIAADVLITSSPGKYESVSGQTTGEIEVYGVDVPVLFGWKIINKDAFNFRVFGGAVMRYNFVEKVKTSYNDESLETNNDWQFKGGPKWSVTAGTGIDIAFVTLDVRYHYSLTDYSNITSSSIHNHGLQINLGFKIL